MTKRIIVSVYHLDLLSNDGITHARTSLNW